MKKYFLSCLISPVFAPVITIMGLSLFLTIVYCFFPHSVPQISEEYQLIDIITYVCYGLAIGTFIIYYRDFSDRKTDYFAYLFLTISALLREAGIQHWLTSTDSTAIKIKFFTNTNNPLHEKIITFLILLVVISVVIYLLKKYTVYLFKSFFKMDTLTWSFGTLVAITLYGKVVDRFPSNFRKYTGEVLDVVIKDNLSVMEEASKIFIPLLIMLMVIQYHFIKKKK